MKTTMSILLSSSLYLALYFALAALNPASAEVNVKQAEALMKANKCSSCHNPTKTKSGPSLVAMAEKHQGEADAVEKLISAMTTGPMIKTDDGEEEHKIIKTKNQAELTNLAEWILSHAN
jgi:cytochrome c